MVFSHFLFQRIFVIKNGSRLEGGAILMPFFPIGGLFLLKMAAQLGKMVVGYRVAPFF